jgi:para-aminobenzoate synthetase / 4-amino-4-deoxychorismate lyase
MTRAAHVHDALFVSREQDLRFTRPVDLVEARTLDAVLPALRRVQNAVDGGLYAAGYIAYEAAPAFDPSLTTHLACRLPLAWFGIYEKRITTPPANESPPGPPRWRTGPWRAAVGESAYHGAIARIRELIAAGDTYQVNYTFPMNARFEGDAMAWFRHLCRAQQSDYAAFVDTGRFQVLSVSPELFFELDGEVLRTRPMKGTRRRGRWPEEDREMAAELASSAKDQAENLMIVDLLRNDLGRVSATGSVETPELFAIERYETVWQMTSAVTSRTSASVPEILAALFPCGSVTGAPKVRTMQIIRELEPQPRGVYCGAVGWWGPERRAKFNVAIRTAAIDTEEGTARYSVGGGITWGSSPEGEYEECQVKAAVLSADRPEFELLESLLFDEEYLLLDEHLARLGASADYFGYEADAEAIRADLLDAVKDVQGGALKVRLLVARDGTYRIESGPAAPSTPVRLGLAAEAVDDTDVFLYHKTTHRAVYDRAKASRPDCDDVLLWNQRGEVTETTTANVLLELDGAWVTPPVRCGLLAGTMRANLLAQGAVQEAIVTAQDAARANSIRLVNSVRKQVEARFVG